MDLFQHRYYRTNKILLMVVGLWPHQSTRIRSGILCFIIVGGFCQLIPQILAIVKYHDDWDFLLKSASPLAFEATVIIRVLSSTCNRQKMLTLLNRIRADWQLWDGIREASIIHEYAERGRRLTILYAVTILPPCIIFTMQPVILKIIDDVMKNGSEPGEFAILVDYYNVDEQKFYFYISMYTVGCATAGGIIIIAVNCMFIVYVQHGCGLFAAVGNKLQLSGANERSTDAVEAACLSTRKDMDFEHIVSCIKHHNNAIKYAKLMNATYAWPFFCFVGCYVLMSTSTSYLILKETTGPLVSLRFMIFLVANMWHLYVETNMCQILMDHSIDIRYCIYNSQWYMLSPPARKLLVLMTMRCNVPCKMVAGKISTISIDNFVTILRTTMSYFTFLRSI